MFDNASISTFAEVLEKHGYDYTEYKHRNGYCHIKTDVLINQLKVDEETIRKQAIEDFVKRVQEKEDSLFLFDNGGSYDNTERAYNNGILALDDVLEETMKEMLNNKEKVETEVDYE